MRPPVVCCLLPSLTLAGCLSLSSRSPYSHPGSLAGSVHPAKSPVYSHHYTARKRAKTKPLLASGERYDHREDNQFRATRTSPLSTFSVDVDTASYANVRRMIREKITIPKGAVRVEEMINYFEYDYPEPTGDIPFSVAAEVASCPWKPKHKLVRIALQGRNITASTRPPANLVFLVDVSGSMDAENKLPLLRRSLLMLVNQMRADDHIAIVTYAGRSGVALPSTRCSNAEAIHDAIDNLSAGGSTAGGSGLHLAYRVAKENFKKGGINRVILATDGNFNVGPSSDSELVDLIEEKSRSGVFLSVLGFGMGNYNDAMLEKLSGKGNGNYAYIDTLNEARKVMIRQTSGTLVTIAKDVKIQVEFNPARVKAHRLIGYENRLLEDRDFTDDNKDAGEIGAGHQVTAFYEIVPTGVPFSQPEADNLKYQTNRQELSATAGENELMTVKLRYKEPSGKHSREIAFPIADSNRSFANASPDFRFASAVSAFGMNLRKTPGIGRASKREILAWAKSGGRNDPFELRKEFIELVRKSSL